MKAIILAAGRGSRMKSLTEERPKCLVEVRGKPLLEHQFMALHAAGIEEIAIVTGYKREMLARRGTFEFHNPRWAETNMVTSLSFAEDWLLAGPCIVSYSDIFYGEEAVRSLMTCSELLAVTYDTNWLAAWTKRFGDPLLDAETFQFDGEHHLLEIGFKPRSVDEVQGQYMGLLKFTPQGWEEIRQIRATLSQAEQDKMHMTGTLQKVIEAGHIPVGVVPYSGDWGEVDAAEDLAVYDRADDRLL